MFNEQVRGHKMTTEYNQAKRAESISYLKERNKYLLDANTFIPTSAVATDVGKTIEQFLTNQNTQFTRRCHK